MWRAGRSQRENQELKRRSAELEAGITEQRDLLGKLKRERDRLKAENARLRQEAGLVGIEELLRDYQLRKARYLRPHPAPPGRRERAVSPVVQWLLTGQLPTQWALWRVPLARTATLDLWPKDQQPEYNTGNTPTLTREKIGIKAQRTATGKESVALIPVVRKKQYGLFLFAKEMEGFRFPQNTSGQCALARCCLASAAGAACAFPVWAMNTIVDPTEGRNLLTSHHLAFQRLLGALSGASHFRKRCAPPTRP